MSTSLSEFNEFFTTPHESHASLVPTQRKSAAPRFDPYAPSSKTVASRADRSTGIAATVVPVNKNASKKKLVRPLEDYGVFDPSRILPEHPNLMKYKRGKRIFWFYLLSLLMDSSKKHVIAWTGRGREFIILSPSELCKLWSEEQGLTKPVMFESVRRTLRACYKARTIVPVEADNYRYSFNTEPAMHVAMSPAELSAFISTNSLKAPSTGPVTRAPMHSYPTPAVSTESSYFTSPSFSTRLHTPPATADPKMHLSAETFNFSNCPVIPFPSFTMTEIDHSLDSYWSPPATTLTPAQFQALDEYFAEHLN